MGTVVRRWRPLLAHLAPMRWGFFELDWPPFWTAPWRAGVVRLGVRSCSETLSTCELRGLLGGIGGYDARSTMLTFVWVGVLGARWVAWAPLPSSRVRLAGVGSRGDRSFSATRNACSL